jgi:hypothetical protein
MHTNTNNISQQQVTIATTSTNDSIVDEEKNTIDTDNNNKHTSTKSTTTNNNTFKTKRSSVAMLQNLRGNNNDDTGTGNNMMLSMITSSSPQTHKNHKNAINLASKLIGLHEGHVPSHIRSAVNSDCNIEWKIDETASAKFFGIGFARGWYKFFTTTYLRITLWFLTFTLCVLFEDLSQLDAFPGGHLVNTWILYISQTIFILFSTPGVMSWTDYRIYKMILFRGPAGFLNFFASMLFSLGIGGLLGWQPRAWTNILHWFMVVMYTTGLDAMPSTGRAIFSIPFMIVLEFQVVFLLVVFNLGIVPNQDHNAVIFSYTLSNNVVINYSAFNMMNDGGITIAILALNELWFRFTRRKSGEIRTINIPLIGVDAIENDGFKPFEKLEFLV